jgi:hypothetical protein
VNSKHFFAKAISCGRLERAGAVMNRENPKYNSDYDSLESEDTKLRQSINTLTRKEYTLLDVGAAAEIQKEIQNRVMLAIKASAKSLEEQSGVKPSLTDTEIRNHLEMVVQELRDTKIKKMNKKSLF